MIEHDTYREKSDESLAGAVSEFANGRYNNRANRCYYSCFLAAVHALATAGIRPSGTRATWGHDSLQATFARELIQRTKVYPAALRDTLPRLYLLREAADYKRDRVSATQAQRALQRARVFLQTVQPQGGGTA